MYVPYIQHYFTLDVCFTVEYMQIHVDLPCFMYDLLYH